MIFFSLPLLYLTKLLTHGEVFSTFSLLKVIFPSNEHKTFGTGFTTVVLLQLLLDLM